MNKTFTLALAAASIAGMICAEIVTPPAGYVEVESEGSAIYVGNPFLPFSGSAKLGDFDGSLLGANASVKVISSKGKTLFTASWKTIADVSGWYDGNSCSNSYPIARGVALQFSGENEDTIVFAGPLAQGSSENVTLPLAKGHNFIASVSPVAKTLGDLSVGGTFNFLSSSYFYVANQKVTYVNAAKATQLGITNGAGWYAYPDVKNNPKAAASKNSLSIPAGTGFRAYITVEGANISLDGSIQ